MPKKPFNEILFQRLYACFGAAGVNPNIYQIEKLRNETEKLADDLNKEMKLTAIALLRRVENHIDKAFKEMDEKIDKIKLE
jgi:hypothetical protein